MNKNINKNETNIIDLNDWKYLDVIENCSWEWESWHFIFTIENQDKDVLYKLINFLKSLNEDYKIQRKNFLESDTWKSMVEKSSIFFRPRPLIANSSFSFNVKNEIKTYSQWDYMSNENWINTAINIKKLEKVIFEYNNSKEKSNPFYKWWILDICD